MKNVKQVKKNTDGTLSQMQIKKIIENVSETFPYFVDYIYNNSVQRKCFNEHIRKRKNYKPKHGSNHVELRWKISFWKFQQWDNKSGVCVR